MSAHGRNRRIDAGRVLRAALLLGFAALIGKLFVTGEMVKYMAPALDPLTALTALVLGAMGVVEFVAGASHHHDGTPDADGIEQGLTFALMVLPLALGIVFAPRALGAGALGGEPASSLLLAYAGGSAPSARADPPAPSRPIADTVDVLAYLRQAGIAGVGQRVRATGLVLVGEGLDPREFALLRYSITHCVADARPLALLVVGPGAPPTAGQWVEVDGVLDQREREGSRLVTIVAARIQSIPEPENPYLGSVF